MSQLPAFALVGLLVAAVLLVLVAGRLARGLRGAGGRIGQVAVALLLGLAGACVTLVVLGMRHYGGTTRGFDSGQDGVRYTCDQWYQEAAVPAGQSGLPGDSSTSCRDQAIAAIWPGLGRAALVGLVVALLALAFVALLRAVRARRDAAPKVPVRYVDTDS